MMKKGLRHKRKQAGMSLVPWGAWLLDDYSVFRNNVLPYTARTSRLLEAATSVAHASSIPSLEKERNAGKVHWSVGRPRG